MSKNLSLKGAAFGALVALSLTAIAPASAAGLADNTFVSLTPTVGTEYAVPAGANSVFSLKSNQASGVTVASRNLKFLVADTAAKLEPAANSTAVDAVAAASTGNWTLSSTTATINTAAAHLLRAGDRVTLAGFEKGTNLTSALNATWSVASVTDSDTFTITVDSTVAAEAPDGMSTASVQYLRGGRSTANAFVYDTKTATNTSNKVLELTTGANTGSISADVTAWVDSNDDDAIDATEYASPTRTVKFVTATDLTVLTTLTPIVGDDKLTAKITTTPVLNGEQALAKTPVLFNAAFTRQDSATTLYASATQTSGLTGSTTSVWNDTTKTFSVVVPLEAYGSANAALKTTITADTGAVSTNGYFAGLASPAGSTTVATVIADYVATSTVSNPAAHNLRVGDKISFAANNPTLGAGTGTTTATTVTVASVPSATTFTWTSTVKTLASNASDYTVETWASNKGVVDRVFAGTYTAQATFFGNVIGVKATSATAAATSSKVTASTTSSASVQGKSFTAGGTNTVKVKTGTTSVDVNFTVTDVDGAAVTAGRPVVLTLSGALNDTFKVNGKSTTDTLFTDANGQVKATVTAATGIANAAVSLDAVAEGVPTSGVDLVWESATVGIVNLSGTSAADTSASATPHFTIVKGGSYTLSLGVADQFNTPADASLYRFQVTGNGITEGNKSLTGGKADITITDTLGSTLTTVIALQKATAGVYATTHTWTVTTYLTTAPTVLAGAKGSTLYGNAVVTSAAVALKDIVEIDKRSSTAVTPAYGTAANYLVLNGQVASSLTSVGQDGAIVTVSGASNILFENGEVTKKGSLTLVADQYGKFEVKAYSTAAQTDSVITFTSNGKSATVKVTFTGVSTSVKKLTVTPNAATYIPGQTVLYTVKLTDNLGNPVNTTAPAATPTEAYITVSYAGPGIISQTLPLETDASGEAQVRIVTGVVDSQAAVLTVKYDQNFDGDFVDTYDLVATSTVYAAGTAPSSAVVAASGSTAKFYVSTSASAGKTVVVKVAGKFVKSFAGSAAKKVVAIAASKGSKAVTVFVGGKLALTKTVTVK